MRPSAQQLTHPYPAWSGCTLNEMGIIALVSGFIVLALLIFIGLLLHHVMLCLIPFLPFTFVLTKMLLKRLADTKETKPEGFMLIQVRLWLAKHVGFSSPYVTRFGHWSTFVR